MAFCPLGPSDNKLLKALELVGLLATSPRYTLGRTRETSGAIKRAAPHQPEHVDALKMLLLCADAAPAFRVGEQVCTSYPSDTIYPKTHNASAPKTHASRLPIANASYRLTLQAHCDITHSLKCNPPPRVYAYALWAVMGYYWDVWKAHLSYAYRLFPTQFPMDVFVVPWKEDGQDIRDFFSPGRSLVSTASERSMCRW